MKIYYVKIWREFILNKKYFLVFMLTIVLLFTLVSVDSFIANVPVFVATEQELRDAVATAPTDGTIQEIHMTAGFNMTGGVINTPNDSYIRIYGNHTITNAAQFNLGTGSHLLIDGLSLQGNSDRNFGINIDTVNATFTLKSGRIEGFGTDGIRSTSNANNTVINIYDGYIGDNGRAGVLVDGGNPPVPMSKVYMYGGIISNNVRYGIWLYRNTDLEMHGGTIAENATGVRLGGAASTTFTMYDGEIVHNVRTDFGGAGVWVGVNSIFTMNGGYIKHNQAPMGGGVRLGGSNGGTGRMIMNNGIITQNTATLDGGGVFLYGGFHGGGIIPTILPSSLTMNGGIITQNTAGRNGGGVHLEPRQQGTGPFSITAWPNLNFQDGIISSNIAGNDGGGIWVNWTNRIFPPAGTAFRDITLGTAIGGENIFDNISRQLYGITDFDRDRLVSHTAPGGARWFADHQISLWNNHQINYVGGVELNNWIIYGVRAGQGTLGGMLDSSAISGPLGSSPVAISGNEEITLTATPATEYYVYDWVIGVSTGVENPVFFTQAELDVLVAEGHIEFVDDDGMISLIITNTGHFLIDDIDHIQVFVYFNRVNGGYTPTTTVTPTNTPGDTTTPTPTPTSTPIPTQTPTPPGTTPASTPVPSETPQTTSPSSPGSPQTGDNRLTIPFFLLLIAGTGMVSIYLLRYLHKQKH